MRTGRAPESSRAATNRLLRSLRAGRWRPAAWAEFLTAAGARSAEQAAAHPGALVEGTVLHAFLLAATHGTGRRWITTSWVLTTLHLGMLEPRRNLGAANTLTLIRANLPVTGAALGRWLGFAAMTTDFIDGQFARRTDTTTPFGAYADPLADAAFWTWFAFTNFHRDTRGVQIAVTLTWLAPAAVVTARSFRRGEMVDQPRPTVIRPAVALQVLLAAHALRSQPRRKTDTAST